MILSLAAWNNVLDIAIALLAIFLFGGTIYFFYFIVPFLMAKLTQATINLYFWLHSKEFSNTRVTIVYLRFGLFTRTIHLQNVHYSSSEYTIFVGDVSFHFSLLRKSGFLGKVLQEHVTQEQGTTPYHINFPHFPAAVTITGIDVHYYSRKNLPYVATEEGFRQYMDDIKAKASSLAKQRKVPFLFSFIGPMSLDLRGLRVIMNNPYLRCGIRVLATSAHGIVGVYQTMEFSTSYNTCLDLKFTDLNVNIIENEFYNPIFDFKRQVQPEKWQTVPLYCGKTSLSVQILSAPISRVAFSTVTDICKVQFHSGLHFSQDRKEVYEQSFPEGIIAVRLVDAKITYSPWIERERRRIFACFFPETFLSRPIAEIPPDDAMLYRPTLNYKVSIICDTTCRVQYWYRNTDQPYSPIRHDIIVAWKHAQMEYLRITQQLRKLKASNLASYSSGTNAIFSSTVESSTGQGIISSKGSAPLENDEPTDQGDFNVGSVNPATESGFDDTTSLLDMHTVGSLAHMQPSHLRKGSNMSMYNLLKMSTGPALDSAVGANRRYRQSIQGSPLSPAQINGQQAEAGGDLTSQTGNFQSVADLHAMVFKEDLFTHFDLDLANLEDDNLDELTYNTRVMYNEDKVPEEQSTKSSRNIWSGVFSNALPFVNKFIRSSASKGEQIFDIFRDLHREKEDINKPVHPPSVGAYTSPHEGLSFTCSAGTTIVLKVPVFHYVATRNKRLSVLIPRLSATTTVLKQEFLTAENVSLIWNEEKTGKEYAAPTKWDVGFFAENFQAELSGVIISQITHLLGDMAEDDSDLLSYYRKTLIPLIDNNTVILSYEFPTRNMGYNQYCNAPPNRLQTLNAVQYTRTKKFVPTKMVITLRLVNYEIGVITATDNACTSLHNISTIQPVQDFLINKYTLAYHRLYCKHNFVAERDYKEMRFVSAHHYVQRNNPFLNLFWHMLTVMQSPHHSIYSLLYEDVSSFDKEYKMASNLLTAGASMDKETHSNIAWLKGPINIPGSISNQKKRRSCLCSRKKKAVVTVATPVMQHIYESEQLLSPEGRYVHSRQQSAYSYDILGTGIRPSRGGSGSGGDDTSLVPASAHSVTVAMNPQSVRSVISQDTFFQSTIMQQDDYEFQTVDDFLAFFKYGSPDEVVLPTHRLELLRIANNKKATNDSTITYDEYLALMTYSKPSYSRMIFSGPELSCLMKTANIHNRSMLQGATQFYNVMTIKVALRQPSLYMGCSPISKQNTFLSRLYKVKRRTASTVVSPFKTGSISRTDLRIGTVEELTVGVQVEMPVTSLISPAKSMLSSTLPPAGAFSKQLKKPTAPCTVLSIDINIRKPELLVNGAVITLYMHFLENMFLAQRFIVSEIDYMLMPFGLRFKNQLARAYDNYHLYRRLEAKYLNDVWLNDIRKSIQSDPNYDATWYPTDADVLTRITQHMCAEERIIYANTLHPTARATALFDRFAQYLTPTQLFLTIYAEKPTVCVSVHEYSEIPRRFSFGYIELNKAYDTLFDTSLTSKENFIVLQSHKLTFSVLSSRTGVFLSVDTAPLRGAYTSQGVSTLIVGGFNMNMTICKIDRVLHAPTFRTAYTMCMSSIKLNVQPNFVYALIILISNFIGTFTDTTFNRCPVSLKDHNVITDKISSTATTEEGKFALYTEFAENFIAERVRDDLDVFSAHSDFLTLCNYLENLNDGDHASLLQKIYGQQSSTHQSRLSSGTPSTSKEDASPMKLHRDDKGASSQATSTSKTLFSKYAKNVMFARCPDRLRYLLYYNGSDLRLETIQGISFDISLGRINCLLQYTFPSTAQSKLMTIEMSALSKRGLACYINNYALKDSTRLIVKIRAPDLIVKLRDPVSNSTSIALHTSGNFSIHQTGDNSVNRTGQLLYQDYYRSLVEFTTADRRARAADVSIPIIVILNNKEFTCKAREVPKPPDIDTMPEFCENRSKAPSIDSTLPIRKTESDSTRGSARLADSEQYHLPPELEAIVKAQASDKGEESGMALRKAMYLQFVAPTTQGIATARKSESYRRPSVATDSPSITSFYSTDPESINPASLQPSVRQSARISQEMVAAEMLGDSSLYSTDTTAPDKDLAKMEGEYNDSYDLSSDSILLPARDSSSNDGHTPTVQSVPSWSMKTKPPPSNAPSLQHTIYDADKIAGIVEVDLPLLLPSLPFHSIVDPRLGSIYASILSRTSASRPDTTGRPVFCPQAGTYMYAEKAVGQSKKAGDPTNLPSIANAPMSEPLSTNISIEIGRTRVYFKPEGMYAVFQLLGQILSPDFTTPFHVYTFVSKPSGYQLSYLKNIYLSETMLRKYYYIHLKKRVDAQGTKERPYIFSLANKAQLDVSSSKRKDRVQRDGAEHGALNESKSNESGPEKIFSTIAYLASQAQIFSSLNLSHFGFIFHQQLDATISQIDGTDTRPLLFLSPYVEQYKIVAKSTTKIVLSLNNFEVVCMADGLRTRITCNVNKTRLLMANSSKLYGFNHLAYRFFCRLPGRFCSQVTKNKVKIPANMLISCAVDNFSVSLPNILVCTIKSVNLNLDHSVFTHFTQGVNHAANNSKHADSHSSTTGSIATTTGPGSVLKPQIVNKRGTMGSEKKDNSSYNIQPYREDTDMVSAEKTHKMEAIGCLQTILNAFRLEAESLSINVPLLLLQPLIIMIQHYVVAMQKGIEVLTLSTVITNLSRYILLSKFVGPSTFVWYSLGSTVDTTKSRKALLSNIFSQKAETRLDGLFLFLANRENNPTFAETNLFLFQTFCKTLHKDHVISIGKKVTSQMNLRKIVPDSNSSDKTRGLRPSLTARGTSMQTPAPSLYKVHIDADLKPASQHCDCILLMALTLKNICDRGNAKTENISSAQLMYWQFPEFNSYMIPMEPIILHLNHMTRHLFIKSKSTKVRAALSASKNDTKYVAKVRHKIHLKLNIRQDLSIKATSTTNLGNKDAVATAASTLSMTVSGAPPHSSCFRALLSKPEVELAASDRIAIRLTYRSLDLVVTPAALLLFKVLDFNAFLYTHNIDKVLERQQNLTYNAQPSLLFSNINSDLFSNTGVYRILLMREAAQTPVDQSPETVPASSSATIQTTASFPPVSSEPMERFAFQAYVHEKVSTNISQQGNSTSINQDLSFTGTSSRLSNMTLSESSTFNSDDSEDDLNIIDAQSTSTSGTNPEPPAQGTAIPYSYSYDNMHDFTSTTLPESRLHLQTNAGSTQLPTSIFGIRSLSVKDAESSVVKQVQDKLSSNVLVQSETISADDMTHLYNRCGTKGQASINRWLEYVSRFSDMKLDILLPNNTFSIQKAASEILLLVIMCPSVSFIAEGMPPAPNVFVFPFLCVRLSVQNIVLETDVRIYAADQTNTSNLMVPSFKRESLVDVKSFTLEYVQSVIRFHGSMQPSSSPSSPALRPCQRVETFSMLFLAHQLACAIQTLDVQFFNAQNRFASLLRSIIMESKEYGEAAANYAIALSSFTDYALYAMHEYSSKAFQEKFCFAVQAAKTAESANFINAVVVDTEIPHVYSSASLEIPFLQMKNIKHANRVLPFLGNRTARRPSSSKHKGALSSARSQPDVSRESPHETKDSLVDTLNIISGNHILLLNLKLNGFMIGVDVPRLMQSNIKMPQFTVSLSSIGQQTVLRDRLEEMTSKSVFLSIFSSNHPAKHGVMEEQSSVTMSTTGYPSKHCTHLATGNQEASDLGGTSTKATAERQLFISSIISLLTTNRREFDMFVKLAPIRLDLHSSYIHQDIVHTLTIPDVESKFLFKDFTSLAISFSVAQSENSFSGELFLLIVSLVRKITENIEGIMASLDVSSVKDLCSHLSSTALQSRTQEELQNHTSRNKSRPKIAQISISFTVAPISLSITSETQAVALLIDSVSLSVAYVLDSNRLSPHFNSSSRSNVGGEFSFSVGHITLFTVSRKTHNNFYMKPSTDYVILKAKDVDGLTKITGIDPSACSGSIYHHNMEVINGISCHLSLSLTLAGKFSADEVVTLNLLVVSPNLLFHPLLYIHIVESVRSIQVWHESYNISQKKFIPRMGSPSSIGNTLTNSGDNYDDWDIQPTIQTEKPISLQFSVTVSNICVSAHSDCGLEFILSDSGMTVTGLYKGGSNMPSVADISVDELIGKVQLYIIPPYDPGAPVTKFNLGDSYSKPETMGNLWDPEAILAFLSSATAVPTGNVLDFCLSLSLTSRTGVAKTSIPRDIQLRYAGADFIEQTDAQMDMYSGDLYNMLTLKPTLTRLVLALNETSIPLFADLFFSSIKYATQVPLHNETQHQAEAPKINAIFTEETITNFLNRVEVLEQRMLYVKMQLSILQLGLEIYEFNTIKDTIKNSCNEHMGAQAFGNSVNLKVYRISEADIRTMDVPTPKLPNSEPITHTKFGQKRPVVHHSNASKLSSHNRLVQENLNRVTSTKVSSGKDVHTPILSVILPQLLLDLEVVRIPQNDLELYKRFSLLRPHISAAFFSMDNTTKMYVKPATASFITISTTLCKQTLFLPPELFKIVANFMASWLQIATKYSEDELSQFAKHKNKSSSYIDPDTESSEFQMHPRCGTHVTSDRHKNPWKTTDQQKEPSHKSRSTSAGKRNTKTGKGVVQAPDTNESLDSTQIDLIGIYQIMQTISSKSPSAAPNILSNIRPNAVSVVTSLVVEQQVLVVDSVVRPIIDQLAFNILNKHPAGTAQGNASASASTVDGRYTAFYDRLDYVAVSPSGTGLLDAKQVQDSSSNGPVQEDLQPGYEILSFLVISILPISMKLRATKEAHSTTLDTSLSFSGVELRVIPYAVQFIANLYTSHTAESANHAHPLVFSIKDMELKMSHTNHFEGSKRAYNKARSLLVTIGSISLDFALNSFEYMSAVFVIWVHNTEKLRGMVAFRDLVHGPGKKSREMSIETADLPPADKPAVAKNTFDFTLICKSIAVVVQGLTYYKFAPVPPVYLAQRRAHRSKKSNDKDALLTQRNIMTMVLGNSQVEAAQNQSHRNGKTSHKRAVSGLSSDMSVDANATNPTESADPYTGGAMSDMQKSVQDVYPVQNAYNESNSHPLQSVARESIRFDEQRSGQNLPLTDQQLELIIQLSTLAKHQKTQIPVFSLQFSSEKPALKVQLKRKTSKMQGSFVTGDFFIKYGHTVACKIAVNGLGLVIRHFSCFVTAPGSSEAPTPASSLTSIPALAAIPEENEQPQSASATNQEVPDQHQTVPTHLVARASSNLSREQITVSMDATLHLEQVIVHIFESVELAYVSLSDMKLNLAALHLISERIIEQQLQYKKNKTSIGLSLKECNAYVGMQTAPAFYGSLQRVVTDTFKLWKEGKNIVQAYHAVFSLDNILLKLKKYVSKTDRNREQRRKAKDAMRNKKLYLQSPFSISPGQHGTFSLELPQLAYFAKTAKTKLSLQIDSIVVRAFQSTLLDSYHCAVTISKLDTVLTLFYSPTQEQTGGTITLRPRMTNKALLAMLDQGTIGDPNTEFSATVISASTAGSADLTAAILENMNDRSLDPGAAGDKKSAAKRRQNLNSTRILSFSTENIRAGDRFAVTPNTAITLSIGLLTLSYGERLTQTSNREASSFNILRMDDSADKAKVQQGFGYMHKGKYYDYLHVLALRNELSTILSCTEVLKLGRSQWDINYTTICSVLRCPADEVPLCLLQMLSGHAKSNLSSLTTGSQIIAVIGTINSMLSDILAFRRSVSRVSLLNTGTGGDAKDTTAAETAALAAKEAFLQSSMDFQASAPLQPQSLQSQKPKEDAVVTADNMMRIHEEDKLWIFSRMEVENADAMIPTLGLLGKGGNDLLGSIISSTLKSNKYLNQVFTGVTRALYAVGDGTTNLLLSQSGTIVD